MKVKYHVFNWLDSHRYLRLSYEGALFVYLVASIPL